MLTKLVNVVGFLITLAVYCEVYSLILLYISQLNWFIIVGRLK